MDNNKITTNDNRQRIKKIVLTGGGTAGHVMPNLALLPYLKNTFDEIHYIGSDTGLERDILRAYPEVIFHALPSVKLVRSLSLKNLLIPIRLHKSVKAAKQLLDKIKPDLIFSKGGYVALPVCLSAKNYPLIMHESDLKLGLANKLSYKHCNRLLSSFCLADGKYQAEQTGAPLRRELYFGDAAAAQRQFPFSGSFKPCLLVTGGSQGAAAINKAVYGALDELIKHYNILHIVGKKNTDGRKMPGYHQIGFTDRMPDLMAAADLVISRGGANTLFELVSLKKPALVIPLPKARSRGDQIDNAQYFERRGCVHMLLQENLTPQNLLAALSKLSIAAPELKRNMATEKAIDGTVKIYHILKQYGKA